MASQLGGRGDTELGGGSRGREEGGGEGATPERRKPHLLLLLGHCIRQCEERHRHGGTEAPGKPHRADHVAHGAVSGRDWEGPPMGLDADWNVAAAVACCSLPAEDRVQRLLQLRLLQGTEQA